MNRLFRWSSTGCLLLLLVGAVAAADPVITGTNSSTLARSGRLSITGTGFGTAGTVLIAGLPALDSAWTDARIVAYVPEEAPLGATEIVVDAGGQQSNAVPLTVTTRQADGRVNWIFEIDSEYLYYRPAQAPDGTLYVHARGTGGSGQGRIFALAPDGALLWIYKDLPGSAYVPPAAGPDGAVYAGTLDTLYRISPAGELDWTFQGGLNIQSGAVVGPDGTVYAGFEHPPEAVALDPATGALIWSNSPGLSAYGTGGNEARLGRSAPGGPYDRFYLWWDQLGAFSLDGDHLFTTTAGNIYDHEVAVGSDGTLYTPVLWDDDLGALSPFNGDTLWVETGPWNVVSSDVEIGPDDMLYFVGTSSWLEAFDPYTRTSKWRRDVGYYLRRPSLSPDGTTLLTGAGGTCNTPNGDCVIAFIKAFDTTNGDELWHIDLDEVWDPEFRSITWDHGRVSADSRTAYFTGFILGSGDASDEHSLLWSVQLVDGAIFADGFESGDTSAWTETVP